MVELLLREEFGDPKRVRSSGHFIDSSSKGRGFHRGGGTPQHRGLVHALLPALEGGQGPCSSPGYNQGSPSFQQRPVGRGGYSVPPLTYQSSP